MDKDHVVAAICDAIGIPMIPLGPGSKEKKQVFEEAATWLGLLPVGATGTTKPGLAELIVVSGGLMWDESCHSTGDTITKVGLERVLTVVTAAHVQRPPQAPTVGRPYVAATGVTGRPEHLTFEMSLDALDQGTIAHARIQNALAAALRAVGIQPLSPQSPEPPFDLGFHASDRFAVCEVKSADAGSAVEQMRLGLGQVLEYRYRLQRGGVDRCLPLLVMEVAPPAARGICASVGCGVFEEESLDADLGAWLDLQDAAN
jgi:hypothetical protein